jgi:hypothetical protein
LVSGLSVSSKKPFEARFKRPAESMRGGVEDKRKEYRSRAMSVGEGFRFDSFARRILRMGRVLGACPELRKKDSRPLFFRGSFVTLAS